MKIVLTRSLFFICLFALFLYSCKKEDFETDKDAKLEFSQDTIVFDTVFTGVGSSTELFIVYNTGKKPIRISSLRLASGNSSNFRLNVDGIPGKAFENIEIGSEDSIFIFVEVTVDPNMQNIPLIITDSILFETNGNLQDVDLVAWGQDAYFHSPYGNAGGMGTLFVLGCNEVWNKDKPHVIYGYALVDSSCSLIINEGTNVHIHPGSGLIVLSSGTLKINGTTAEPVIVQGDRLGAAYKDVPGQWDLIWLSNLRLENLTNQSDIPGRGAFDCEIKNAIIKNGYVGLRVDSFYAPGQPNLRMENTIIKNMAGAGISLNGADTRVFNSVFANCGGQTASMLYGGIYKFYHCTFANFWNNSNRQDPCLYLNNYFISDAVYIRPIDAYFGNCIVYGNLESEISLDSFPNAAPGKFNFMFDHAIMKVEAAFPTSNPAHYAAILRNANPIFRDIENNNYQLDSTSSPAIDAGAASVLTADPILNFDLLNNSRPQGPLPDLGAYERR
ncbi:MAG TPA: choice-of-anchor Q domain-containing protein [Bacteroidia bacterium]|nr:choice-of-anchor Q domain-containing protein [Bacteroidia bacterium]